MHTDADYLIPLPENVLSLSESQGVWNGVGVYVADFHCAGRVVHRLPHETETRLSVVLEEVGGRCEPRLRENRPCAIAHTPRHMHFAPAGHEAWGYSDDIRFVKDATLTFNLAVLGERLGTDFDTVATATPRLRFSDDRIWTLVRLLSDAVNDPDPSAQLYGDGLTAAIAARLFANLADPIPEKISGLAQWQLRRVIEYLDAHLPKHVALADLAALVDLSQSHFSRAFKASTGMAPYRWQLATRRLCFSTPTRRLTMWLRPPALPTRSISGGRFGDSPAQHRRRGDTTGNVNHKFIAILDCR